MNDDFPFPGDAGAPSARWLLRLLGDVALVTAGGGERRLPGRAATALLARLALAPDRAQPREALIDLLWPGVALPVGRNRLRQVLSTLKSVLDAPGAGSAVLLADRLSLRLSPQALVCDASLFEAALRAGRLADARALYRGELLPGFYDEWINDERLRLAALADRLATATTTVTATTPVTAPAAGTPAAALAAAGRPATTRPAVLNLPHYLTRLHGAEAACAWLQADTLARRLVTLLGPGGHGKTRLAVEVARALAAPADAVPPFDLVAFVPLVACPGGTDAADALCTAVLQALRQAPHDLPPLAHLQRLLAGRRTLLVLDNFEQLVDDAAPWVADLLAQCPGVHVLVTSRRALGLDGEHQRVLPALPVPADAARWHGADAGIATRDTAHALAHNPAVALFIDRAQAVRADFHLSARNRDAVVTLVRHLQGMPLAIELAASRVRSLPPATLLALLKGAGDEAGNGAAALHLLSRGGPRAGGDPRHSSMLAVVQWSWQLLKAPARRLLPRLSGFAGSFTLAAAQALAGGPGRLTAADTAAALDELVAHSMLRALPESGRFELFGLIREFAASVLPPGEAAALRQAHRAWLTGWFKRLPLSTPLQQVRPEVANLAAALLGAAADGAFSDAAALAAAAQPAMSAISLPLPVLVALQHCADGLAEPVQRAVTRAGLSRSLLLAGQTADAARLAALALAELPAAQARLAACDTTGAPGLARALVLTRVAHVRWRLQRDAQVRPWLHEALALAEAANAPVLQATILTNLGALLRPRDPAASIVLQRRALALWAAAGDSHGVNVGRCNLALALAAGRAGAAEALALAHEARRDTRAQGDELQHALACNLAGEALSRLGRWPEAASAYRDCITAAFAAAEPWPLVYGLWNLPRPLAHLGQAEACARLMGFAEQHAQGVTGPLSPTDRHDLRRLRRLGQRLAGTEAVARWWQEGATLNLAQAVGLASA